jgi:VIT1/CCC1 family predicted Fe2+/Mn2+ transporter
MKKSYKKGLSFGLTSAVITTLGLMVGLNSGTGSKLAVISGILIIALADAFSDSLGIHISEEADRKNKPRHIWEATIVTFLSKFLFALTFVIPFLFFNLKISSLISIAWGIILLSVLSFQVGKQGRENPYRVVGEHLFIAVIVIILSYLLGNIVNKIV